MKHGAGDKEKKCWCYSQNKEKRGRIECSLPHTLLFVVLSDAAQFPNYSNLAI